MIGRSSVRKRTLTREAYEQGRIRYFQQDGNREFISCLACVCADGSALPPALIYQGASNDLQSTWIEDLDEADKTYFASSENGWTCDALGLAWLSLFHKHTKHKVGNRRRLLIVDGHSSHINMAFITTADSLRILLAILPAHTTHRLQPLDVGLFGPLAQEYTKRLDAYNHGGLGWVSMTKRMFWPLFRDAWKASFTEKNIQKAFEKTGIWPLQPSKTINKIQKPPPSTPIHSRLAPLPIPTPQTAHAIRRLLKTSPSLQKVAILERIVLRLAAKYEIQSHENKGLRAAVVVEVKRRNRGTRLNLMGEEASGKPQFFSPTKVIKARAFQETKKAAEEEERRQKALRKEEAAYRRQQREAGKQEAAVQRQLQKEARQEAKLIEKAQKEAEKEEKKRRKEAAREQKAQAALQRKKEQEARKQLAVAAKTVKAVKTRPKRAPLSPKMPQSKLGKAKEKTVKPQKGSKRGCRRSIEASSQASFDVVDLAAAQEQNTSRRGRAVTLPQRFRS